MFEAGRSELHFRGTSLVSKRIWAPYYWVTIPFYYNPSPLKVDVKGTEFESHQWFRVIGRLSIEYTGYVGVRCIDHPMP